MVLVHVQIAFRMYRQVHHAMFADLLQHVVEESQSRRDVTLSRAVQTDLDFNIRLLRGTLHLCITLTGKEGLRHLVPTAYLQELTSDVLRKLAVGITVTNHITVGDIVLWIVHVFLHQSCVGLPRWCMIFWEMGINQDFVKLHTLSFQCLQDEVMDRPEGVFWKRVGTQSVLVADHDKLKVETLTDEHEVTDGTLHEFQFLERIYLLVGRFLDNSTVTVDE